MMENTLTTRSRDLVSLLGLMVEGTREAGLMVNSMDLVFTLLQKEKSKRESGRTAKE